MDKIMDGIAQFLAYQILAAYQEATRKAWAASNETDRRRRTKEARNAGYAAATAASEIHLTTWEGNDDIYSMDVAPDPVRRTTRRTCYKRQPGQYAKCPEGVALMNANGSRQQWCRACGAEFKHGYLLAARGKWFAACSDPCLMDVAARIGLTVKITTKDNAPQEWTAFDSLAVSEPEMIGLNVHFDPTTNGWMREGYNGAHASRHEGFKLPEWELRSEAQEFGKKDVAAAVQKAEAEALAARFTAKQLVGFARKLSNMHRAERDSVKRTKVLRRFKLCWAALAAREKLDADRRDAESAREDFRLRLEAIDDPADDGDDDRPASPYGSHYDGSHDGTDVEDVIEYDAAY